MEALRKITEYINNNMLEEAFDLIIDKEEELGDLPEFWNAKAIICSRVREYEVALNCLKRALNLDLTNADAYYNLAYICEKMGIYDDAAVHYGFAQKYTSDPELLNELENIYIENMPLRDIKDTVVHSKKKTFIILSSCGWGNVLQRMHHISRSLVKLGQEVFYVSPTANVNLSSESTKLSTVVEYIIQNEKNIEGVRVYQPLNISTNGKFLFNSYTALVQRLIDSSNGINEVVLVAYMPYQVEIIKALQGKFKVIYECVDDHTDLEYAFWGNKQDIVWEQKLMDISDAITTTATSLYLERVSIEKRKNVYLSRNAVNIADFVCSDNDEIPEDLKDIPEPRIVYTGAIYKWFDIDLFYEVVKSNPDKSFVIIGFGQEDMFMEKCPNLYLLGAKKHSELKRYLKYMQIGIIPFKDDTDIIINCDPIKQYEYLACGLPVITTCMPESAINKIYTINVNSKEQFNEAILTSLNTVIQNDLLAEFLVQNSWNCRATLLCQIIDESDNEFVLSEKIEAIKQELSELVQQIPHPNYLILYALSLYLEDKSLFVNYAEKAFRLNNTPYIERQFLKSLYLNNKFQDFLGNAKTSKNIAPYLISELLYQKSVNDTDALETIMLYCVKNFNMAKKRSLSIINPSKRDLISGLYYFLMDDYEKTFDLLNKISEQRIIKESPLYNYLSNSVPVLLKAYKGIEEKEEENCKEYINIHWLMTFGCNFNCPYCTMSHSRSTGHAFDYERPLVWAQRFNNLDRPFSLYITGGEPLLDIVNFTQFYNNIIENENLRHIRIDTNGSISPEKLKSLVVQKTILNVSFHPSQIELSKLFSNLEGYRNLGFSVKMVNMVCKEKDIDDFKKYSKVFREKGFILNLGIYIGGNYPKENTEIEGFSTVLDKLDVGLKTKVFSPKGLKCNASKFFKSMLPDGTLKDCWGLCGNFIENNILTDKVAKECPANECTCIEQYSLLPIFNRNPQASLMEYIDQSILAPQERKTKIVSIIGYFGHENAGDEALLASILERLKIDPTVQPIVIAFANPENVKRLHNVLAVDGQDFDRVTQVLHMSDLVILGPGGLLEDYAALDAKSLFNKQGMYSYLYPVLLSQLYGKHTIGYGLGVGPLKMDESKNAVRLILSGMEKIFVRDNYSFNLLKEIGLNNVEISADAVLNLKPMIVDQTTQFGSISNRSKGLVGISLRPFNGVNSDNLVKQISILIGYLVEKLNLNCVIFPMQYGYDMPLIKSLYSVLSTNIKSHVFILEERINPKSLMSLISSMNIIIGMRLHSIVMASTAKVPFIAISYDPKVSEFAKRAEMSDYIIDVNELSAELLIEKVKKLRNIDEYLDGYTNAIKIQKDQENESWDYLIDNYLKN